MKLLLNAAFQFTPAQRDELARVQPGLQIVERNEPAERIELEGVSILVTEQVPRDLTRAGELRWVQLLSAGANQVLQHPVFARDIPVTTASGLHGVPIAQYVTGTWLAMVHRLPELFELKSTRVWPNRAALAGFNVRGLTAGVIGYGSIGRECARQLHGLGMRILCLKRDPAQRQDHDYNFWPGTGDPEGRLPDGWFGPTQLPEFLPQCDLVVVTVPSTAQTVGLIGRGELEFLKPSARIIIISRGGIVDESALAAALRESRIAGAVVDCFVREPLPADHVFFEVPGLLLTPHMSGVYEGFWPAMVELLKDNLRRFEAGQSLLNRVDPQFGY